MDLTRRAFLGRLWKVLAAFLGVEAGWTTWDALRPRVSQGFGAEIPAGSPQSFADDTVRYLADGRLYIVRVEGKLKALYQKCPHLGCRVPYCESSGRFECPCHGSIFNRKGEYIAGPSPRGMDSFPLQVQGGGVVVDTGTVVTGPARGIRTLDERPGPSCLTEVAEEQGPRRPRAPGGRIDERGGGAGSGEGHA